MVGSASLPNRRNLCGIFFAILLCGIDAFSGNAIERISSRKLLHAETSLQMSSTSSSNLSRRQVGELIVAGVGLGGSFIATRENKPSDYGLFGVLPVGPYKTKYSVFETLDEGQLWTVTQKFGILDVQVPLRMTILKLEGGGLFIYDPVAATPEVVSYIHDLEKIHGPVKHIVLGSVAIEHKVYSSVMAQKFKNSKVWLQPGQYSFPSNLPDSFLGFPSSRTEILPFSMDSPNVPNEWKESNLEFKILGPFISKDGAFGEAVFYHGGTKTLMVTDTVVEVTDEVPSIYDKDLNPILYHARDTVTDAVTDTIETRKKGWRRIVLFGLFFMPSAITIKDAKTAFDERMPDINSDFAGIYPWDWTGDDEASFNALKGGLLVAPILQKLILNRNPIEVLDFADEVAKWDIKRIIPAHLKNDLKYDGKAYRKAFGFLEAGGMEKGLPNPLDADFQTLCDAEVNLVETGKINKSPALPGGKISRSEVLAESSYGCRGGICTPRSNP